jgi:indolepyruvate decarboxylase
MAKQKIGDYLFGRIKELGVAWTFGIPGDFVLPLYAAQARTTLKTVVMNHEPSVGFAADAYGRLNGLGVALVTYGAGGLNMVNPTALAYAEESPLLVISGAPEARLRKQKPHLHHCVKSFDTQLNVFREVTESQALIESTAHAQSSIERVLKSIQVNSRPGYIEISRDMVNTDVDITPLAPEAIPPELPQVHAALHEITEKIAQAKLPVLFAGAQIRRFNLLPKVVAIAEALNLPVVTSILGKASFPESHPNFIGTYFGRFGEAPVREYVESSDCIVGIGVVLSEMETGGYTAELPAEKLILINNHEMTVGHHHYLNVDLRGLVDQFFISVTGGAVRRRKLSIPSMALPMALPDFDENKQADTLTVGAMLAHLNKFIDERFAIVSDVGDCLYAGLSLKTDTFVAPGYYSSMGFGVPAGIGVQLANPKIRSLVLVGDGGFQMTGTEISTAAKLGINPIFILFNNSSYAMLRFIDQERDYYNLGKWDYCQVAKALGADALRATTKSEFKNALNTAVKSDLPFLIDAVLSETDISPTLRRLTDHFGARVRASIS